MRTSPEMPLPTMTQSTCDGIPADEDAIATEKLAGGEEREIERRHGSRRLRLTIMQRGSPRWTSMVLPLCSDTVLYESYQDSSARSTAHSTRITGSIPRSADFFSSVIR